MSLFQRIKTPFGEAAESDSDQPERRAHAVGSLLRARREELDLDIAAIGEALRIKPAFLAALEQGRTQDLPGPTYAIGFVRSYARHLGLDANEYVERFKRDISGRAEDKVHEPAPIHQDDGRRLPQGWRVVAAHVRLL